MTILFFANQQEIDISIRLNVQFSFTLRNCVVEQDSSNVDISFIETVRTYFSRVVGFGLRVAVMVFEQAVVVHSGCCGGG